MLAFLIAWFQATNAGQTKDTVASLAQTVTKTEAIAAADIDVTFTWSRTGDSATYDKLQLTEYQAGLTNIDASDGFSTVKYRYYAYDANHNLKASSLGSKCAPSWGYQLKITSVLSDDQKAALAGSSVTITVGNATTMATQGVSNRVAVWLKTAVGDGASPVADASVPLDGAAASEQTVALTEGMINGTDPVIYAGVYVHGNESVDSYNFGSADTGANKEFTWGVLIHGTRP